MRCDLSIVIPVFNEEANILPLTGEILEALSAETRSWELVFVDDASTDGTWRQVQEAHRLTPRVRGVRHRRNAGQSAAVWTGIGASSSPILATLDGDRQNDPRDFPALLAALEDCDLVCGVRRQRRDHWIRRVSSGIARRARRWVLGVDFSDSGCGFRAFRRSALGGVIPFNGMHRFLPILVHGGGGRTREIGIHHRPRLAGVSKYGIWNRLGRGIVDLMAIAWYQKRRLRPVPCDSFPMEPERD